MNLDETQRDHPVSEDDAAEFSWSSLAKTVQGVARNPALAAVGKGALQMAPSVLGGAAQGAMAGGPMGALLGVGGAALSGLTAPKGAAGTPAPQAPLQLSQLAGQVPQLAAQVMPALPASLQSNLGPLLQLLQNPQLAGLLGALGGGAKGLGASDGEAQDGVYDFLVENGFAEES
jgi:hypothetical protein